MNKLLEEIDAELASIQKDNDISDSLGHFLALNDDVLGIGIYNLFGNSIFTTSKDENGEVGLHAFKSLLGLVGNQIDFILPPESNVQFIAPEGILIGISKIGPDKIFAVVLERNAKLAPLVPNIVQIAKLLKGISKKTSSISNARCMDTYRKTLANRVKTSPRHNLIERLAG